MDVNRRCSWDHDLIFRHARRPQGCEQLNIAALVQPCVRAPPDSLLEEDFAGKPVRLSPEKSTQEDQDYALSCWRGIHSVRELGAQQTLSAIRRGACIKPKWISPMQASVVRKPYW
jgi:hypothetical protein